MTAFNTDSSSIAYIPDQYVDSGGLRIWGVRNAEVWFRMFGDSFTVEYRAAGTQPLWISVDGGAWALIAASQFPGASATVTNTSLNLLPGSPTDDWHDIRLRTANAYGDTGFRWQITNGLTITSSGGTAQLDTHSEFGAHEALRGTHGSAYFDDTYSDTNTSLASGYGGADPIFPAARPTSATTQHHESYCRFNVDGNTTKLWPLVEMTGDDQWEMDIWVNGKMVDKMSSGSDGTSHFLGTPLNPVTIPGSGVREVIVGNAKSLYGMTIDGAFPETAVSVPETNVLLIGDSVTEGNSHTQDGNVVTWHTLIREYRGDFRTRNCGLSGDTVTAATTANRVDNDYANANHSLVPDIIVCNYGINDASRFNSVPSTVEAEYVAFFQDILATFPSAILYAVPPVDSTTGFDDDVRTGISNAVTTVDDARCIFIDSAGWDVNAAIREGSHPDTLGYGQGAGFAVIQIDTNPSSGNSVTVDGTEYAFGSGGDVTVTIGSDELESTDNLVTALEANGVTVLVQNSHDFLGTADPGVVMSGVSTISDSGSGNVNGYLESAGWLDAYVAMLGELPSEGGSTPTPGSETSSVLSAYIALHGTPVAQLDITPKHPGVTIDLSGISQPGIIPNG